MNKKAAQFNLQGMLIAGLTVGLVFTVFIAVIGMMSGNYNTEGYSQSDVEKYNLLPNISEVVDAAYQDVEKVTVDPNAFDYLASLWNKVTAPFKFIYRSFALIFNLTGDAVSDLNLMPVIAEFLGAVFIVLVIIGIVLIKNYMGRQK